MLLFLLPFLLSLTTPVVGVDADVPAWAATAALPRQPPGLAPPALGLLSNVFGDHMVLQAGQPIAVWGFAPPRTAVTVTFTCGAGALNTTVASAAGQWRLTLPPCAAGPTPYTLTASTPAASVTLTDVLVGSVFFLSGQSNLSGATTSLAYVFNASASEAEAGGFPQVRLLQVGERATQGLLPPQAQLGYDPALPWSVASAGTAAVFSGVGYMFGKVLARELGAGHPIGLVESAWSGTCIQAWLPAAALAQCGAVPPAQGWQTNSTLYNQMVAPFAGMAVAGVVWVRLQGVAGCRATFFSPSACPLAHSPFPLLPLSPIPQCAPVALQYQGQ